MSGSTASRESVVGNRSAGDSLEADFENAMALMERLESGELFALSREFRLLHANCLEKLAACLTRVEQLSLFSANETIDDVNTKELKYMNLNFYIAKVLEKTPIDAARTSVDARMSISHLSARKYIEFLSLLNDYGLSESKSTTETLDSLLPNGIHGRFNLNGISKAKSDRKAKVKSHRQIFKLNTAYEEARSRWINTSNPDEELLRGVEISRLELHRSKAWEGVFGLVDELNVLSAAASSFSVAPLQERETPYIPSPYLAATVMEKLGLHGANFDDVKSDWDKSRTEQDSTRVDNVSVPDNKLVGPRGEVKRPFVITSGNQENKKKDIMSNVFGTGQLLPTISIEELVEKELANRAKPEIPAKIDEDEDRDEIADALTMKARKWDDFTESVAKGEGNTLNLG